MYSSPGEHEQFRSTTWKSEEEEEEEPYYRISIPFICTKTTTAFTTQRTLRPSPPSTTNKALFELLLAPHLFLSPLHTDGCHGHNVHPHLH